MRESMVLTPIASRLRKRRALGVAAVLPLVVGGLLFVPGPHRAVALADGVGPAFVQQVSAHKPSVKSLTVKPTGALGQGNRLVVIAGVWNDSHATAKSVADSSGDSFAEISHTVAADGTEQSVWTAVVTSGAAAKPSITVSTTAQADVGLIALEYSGLSSAVGSTSFDVQAHAVGLTGSAAATTVSSGATGPVASSGELALAVYTDSGFGDTLTTGDGYTRRAATAPVGDIEQLAEDESSMVGDTPDGSVGTGPNTDWVMSTIVFKGLGSGAATVPGTPTNVSASPGNGAATVSWSAPSTGGGALTSYTVTPYAAGLAQPSTVVSGSPPALSTTLTGLTNGTSYTFTVAAVNAVGSGPVSAASSAVTPGPTAAGQWSSLSASPIVAIHDMLLTSGKFLQFDGWQQPQPTYVFDPAANTYTQVTAPDSIFCAGNAFLPDGRVITIGGYGTLKGGDLGIKDTAVFDPATSTWSRVADMNAERWYPTLTELSDGRYVAVSGNSIDANTWADTPEVYDPVANTWTLLTGISTSQVHEEEYPFSYMAPNGKVFTIGPSEDVSYWLDVNAPSWTSIGSSGIYNGSSVMYRPGKILYSGGAPSVTSTTASTNGTAVIDLTATTPTWRTTAPMNQNRVYHTLTMLADGRVLAIGGSGTSDQHVITTGVLPTEIWDPATETWSPAAPIAVSRNYHSTAALMPDGRVLIAGGGHPNAGSDPGQFSTQIYSPSYLFNGARPTITSATAAVSYNSPITVNTPDAASIASVNLVSYAADTHQIDMNQHFVPLSFSQNGGSLTVQSPATAGVAPPGNYMLFVVNAAGVPSVATNVHILTAPPTAPAAPTGVTAVGSNGSANVSWTAPASGGSPITSYRVIPSLGSIAQTPVIVSGNPPATGTVVTGLTNGASYTFTVVATNGVGDSPVSAPSAAITPTQTVVPAFLQASSAHLSGVASIGVTPTNALSAGGRLVVETGEWNTDHSKVTGVTDSAHDVFTEVSTFVAGDGTEQTVWTAPVTAGAGTRPTVSVGTSESADLGISVLEYSGLSRSTGLGAVDTHIHAVGTTRSAGTVSSGATSPAAAANELAVGFYADSGFGDSVTVGNGYLRRVGVSPTPDVEFLAEDQLLGAGASTSATAGTGANTVWTMGVVVFRTG